jgi:ArsR family transcriptional regulator
MEVVAVDPAQCEARCVNPDAVARARASLSGRGEAIGGMGALFNALGDPTRLRLMVALLDGSLCTCDLAGALGVTESAISHQLRTLRGLALVESAREGRVVYHRLADHHVRELVSIASAHVAEGVETVTFTAEARA